MNLEYIKESWATVFVYIILFIFVLVPSLASDVFLNPVNISNLLVQAVAVGLVAAGQTFVILVEGIDLSMGSVVSLITCLTTGLIMGRESMVFPVIALVIALSLFIGFCNGYLITKLRISPLIVTLGMMSMVEGSALVYTNEPYGEVPPSFGFLGWGELGFIPFPVLPFAAVFALGIFVLKKTTFGTYVYATGSNEEVARLSGVNTHRVKIIAYIICSFTACLTAIFLSSRMGMGDPLIGERYMLDSIIPVLIGGTSLSGGKGGLVGTIAGVFILTILANGLNLMGLSGWWNWVLEGLIIIIAVAFYRKEQEI